MMQRLMLFFTAFFLSISLLAQNTIKLTGKVLNERNEPVPGATILIEGSGKGIPADIEGRFSLSLEAGKKYTIIISAVSYESKSISEVIVGEGADNVLDVVLQFSKKNDMGNIVVTSTSRRQENTNALLSFQKNNTALSSGLAADSHRFRSPNEKIC